MARRGPKVETAQDLVYKAAIEGLEQLGGKAFSEDDILFKGKELILPENMTLDEAVRFLSKKRDEWENPADFVRNYKYRPWDVAYCAHNALKRAFGVVAHNHSIVMGFFGPEKAPPQMITIPTGPHTTEQIPWGVLELPFLPKVTFELGSRNTRTEGQIGYIHANGPKKYRFAVQGIFELVERELEEHSLYRGKAFDGQDTPNFLDLSQVDPDKIVYAEDVLRQLNANLWTPIQHTEVVQKLGMPFKRAVLLAGDFGVGKSLAINRTGQVCEDREVTFILVRPGRDDLKQAMLTARMYQPAVVAFEDIETIADSGEDAKRMSEILDLFDGIEAKNSKVMLVLTSNHIDKLHAGMLRPGRLDAVIKIGPPDAGGIQKLVEVNMPDGYLDEKIDWPKVARAMEDYLPAFVVESTQRALRYLVARTDGKMDGSKITTDDLCDAADSLREQFTQMQLAKLEPEPNRLDQRLMEVVDQSFEEWLQKKAAQGQGVYFEVGN